MNDSFTELGRQLADGDSIFHRVTYSHNEEDCIGWQLGIANFCEWLDDNGFLVVQIPPEKSGLLFQAGKVFIRIGTTIINSLL